MASYIILLGPPGAGKGTQAQAISQELQLPHISSGDIFRENLKKETELGKLAAGFMNKGELVPDDVTIAMIRERLSRPDCQAGALLDGFPRTPAQAEALSGMLAELGGQVNAVPYISVPEAVLIERLTGRWTCRQAGHIFHEKYNPPQQPGRCDLDGSELYQREDDKAETVTRRIRVYLEQTKPLIDYYQQRGLLIEIDGILPIEQVTASLLAALPHNG
ncbi:MAG TPA: adenylate kinase [Anaerolineales bacterium]|jgi:adenylate kinase|nr:adenylate kinase [Anaerolineales bacterium]